MDNPSVQNVTDISTVTNISTASIVPTDSVAHTELTHVAPSCNAKTVTNVTKKKTARKKENDRGIQGDSEEAQRLWQMRWWFFWVGIIFCILWMIAMVGVSLLVFYITRNFFSLLISAASTPAVEFMRRFSNYLLPMNEKSFLLAKKRIEMKAKKSTKGEQRCKSRSQKS